MTSPTSTPDLSPRSGEKITAAELRAALQSLTERLDQIEANIISLRDGLAAAATQSAAIQPAGETISLDVSLLLMSYDDNGHPVYKAKGGQYQKFGVRVWPEILPALGVNPASLKPGPNAVSLHLVALMGEKGPRKVIALAK
jgi:hypothetical protein